MRKEKKWAYLCVPRFFLGGGSKAREKHGEKKENQVQRSNSNRKAEIEYHPLSSILY